MGITNLTIALVDLVLTDFIKWQQQKARDAAWVPSPADKDEFLASIAGDTPEKIQAEVAAEAGKTWAERQPPKAEPSSPPPLVPGE